MQQLEGVKRREPVATKLSLFVRCGEISEHFQDAAKRAAFVLTAWGHASNVMIIYFGNWSSDWFPAGTKLNNHSMKIKTVLQAMLVVVLISNVLEL